jgi:acyl-CoA thioesterase
MSVRQSSEARDEPEVVSFDESWGGFGGIHGGYVISTMLRAATSASGRPVAALSAHFHAPVLAGPARVSVNLDASGRSATSASVTLSQEALRASAKVLLAEGSASVIYTPSPEVPGPESLAALAMPLAMVPFASHIEIRPVGPGPYSGAEKPELIAWVRLLAPQPYDAAVGAILLDAIAPSLYAIMDAPVPISTIELSAHFVPDAPGTAWTLLSQQTVWATERLCVDEAHLWSSGGVLLAQARQLRRIRRAAPT